MPRVPTVRKADLDRVLRALSDAGMTASAVVIRPGGEVVITPAPTPQIGDIKEPTLTPPAGDDEPANLDSWRARKRGRGAP